MTLGDFAAWREIILVWRVYFARQSGSINATTEQMAIGRAQTYLLESQSKDGRWVVPPLAITDQKSNEGRVQRLVPIYDLWGTAWAGVGLSRSVAAVK